MDLRYLRDLRANGVGPASPRNGYAETRGRLSALCVSVVFLEFEGGSWPIGYRASMASSSSRPGGASMMTNPPSRSTSSTISGT